MIYRLSAITMLLTSPCWAQEQVVPARVNENPFRAENPEIPAPPAGSRYVSVKVNSVLRRITYTIPDDPKPKAPDIKTMVIEQENFDRWMFADTLTPDERWSHLYEKLRVRVDIATEVYRLTDAEKAKLLLAGRGDIKRFIDGVELLRDTFEWTRTDFRRGVKILINLGPLAQIYRESPFNEGSIYTKTFQKMMASR